MKSLYLSIVILIFITVLSISSLFCISKYNNNFLNMLDDLNNKVEQQNIEQASEVSKELLEQWNKSKNFIDMITRHETVNKIDEEIAVLIPLLKNNEIGMLKAQIFKTKKLFENLLYDETPSIQKLI